MTTKPKRQSIYLAILKNVLFLTPFRIVMHGPEGDWISWSGSKNSFARAREIHRKYKSLGFR